MQSQINVHTFPIDGAGYLLFPVPFFIISHVFNLVVGSYKSNEKYRITKYYLRDFKWKDEDYDVFVWIEKPQSLSNMKKPKTKPIIEGSAYTIFPNLKK